MKRAYSLITIQKADSDARVIEGIATTPSTDSVGDIVDPMGASFKLPLPLLWQHMADKPVGEVTFANPTRTGISFRARIARSDKPGPLKDRLDEAFESVSIGLVKGVSIGFFPIDVRPTETGWHFKTWTWRELSLVTLPANEDCTIQRIKAAARQQRVLRPARVVRLTDDDWKRAGVHPPSRR